MELCNIVQEAVIKNISKRKKCKKENWLSQETLQIAEKEEKQKAKKKMMHLNAEFQRIARRDKKAFLSNQCKEIEENNRTRKTRDFFKKIGDIKDIFMQDEDNKGQKQ